MTEQLASTNKFYALCTMGSAGIRDTFRDVTGENTQKTGAPNLHFTFKGRVQGEMLGQVKSTPIVGTALRRQ